MNINMNATTNPLYVAYMALPLANKTLDEIPFDQMPDSVRDVYAVNEDVKSSLWAELNLQERTAVKMYNRNQELAG